MDRTNRVAVIGSGVMGAWTALWLARRGQQVTLVDAYGPGNALSSSGGETRVTRSAHGPDTHYPRWQRRALAEWERLQDESARRLLHETGVLWFAHSDDGFEADALRVLTSLDIPAERLEPNEVAHRFPGIAADDLAWGLYEPEGGALLARRGVAAVAAEAERRGAEVRIGLVEPPVQAGDSLRAVRLRSGDLLEADAFVFACGPWLPALFPQVELSVTRQEVVFFALPPGDARFLAGPMPTWIDYDLAFYGLGSLEGRGFKCAPDAPGPIVDPDSQQRIVSAGSVDAARAFVRSRFPALGDQPVVEGRVCQYESTPDSHFVVDRHPAWRNTWIVGGGSGHGFKHGPVIGEYVAAQVVGDEELVAELAPPDGRFALAPRKPATGLRTSARAGDWQHMW